MFPVLFVEARCSSALFRCMWCVLVCHPHLTIIISFVIIVHLWFIRCPRSFLDNCWCVGVSSITILPLLVQIIRTFATLTNLCSVCAGNTLHYHDTVDFVQDSETEDPQDDDSLSKVVGDEHKYRSVVATIKISWPLNMSDWQFACTEACRNVSADGAVVEEKSNASAGYSRKSGLAVPLEDWSWKVGGSH